MSSSPKGKADYFAEGTFNALCAECGGKFKFNQLVKHWQGYYVCRAHWEPRHPQDYVKARPERGSPGGAQAEPADVFVVGDTFIVTLDGEYILTEDIDSFITE